MGRNTCTRPSVIIVTKENKGKPFLFFSLVFEGFERDFVQKISRFDGRKGLLKSGKLLNLIGHVGNTTSSFQYHCFDSQGAALRQTPGLFTESPGILRYKDAFLLP